MVIIVLAGAVDDAIAPNIKEKDKEKLKHKNITKVTMIAANKASKIVTTTTFPPLSLRVASLKYLPTLKAINDKARSVIKSIPLKTVEGNKFRTLGPIRTPTTI